MANVGRIASLFDNWTPTTWTLIVIGIVQAVALVKVWPLIKGKLNEARKIELDADAGLRGDLLDRINKLEASRDAEPARIDSAIAAERRRCDAELAEMRLDFNQRIDQLMRIIAQNSQSTGVMIGRPGDVATSKANRKDEKK